MDDWAELAGGFFIFQQRRAGESDVCRIGQCLLHALVCLAAVAAVAFIHQHNQVGRIVAALRQFGCRVELVHQGKRNTFRAAAYTLGQIEARQGAAFFAIFLRDVDRTECSASNEITRELPLQIDTIGHDQHAAFFQ